MYIKPQKLLYWFHGCNVNVKIVNGGVGAIFYILKKKSRTIFWRDLRSTGQYAYGLRRVCYNPPPPPITPTTHPLVLGNQPTISHSCSFLPPPPTPNHHNHPHTCIGQPTNHFTLMQFSVRN